MTKNQLTKALAMAIAGTALSAGGISNAAAATTMYNTFNAFPSAKPTDGDPTANGAQPTTDGWVWGGVGFTKASNGSGNAVPGFVGINGGSAVSPSTPFGYAGSGIVNWAVQLGNGSDAAVISQADSASRYGVFADIDTAKGAWSDNAVGGAGGWRHNLDFGLFKSTVATDVRLDIQGLTQSGTDFGFTIFKGMDASTGSYNHHGAWNAGNNASGLTSSSLPGGGTTFTVGDIVAYSVGGATPSNLNSIFFHADANEVYTIVLGGYRNGGWSDTADGYVLNVSAVPIPAAVWLFGSALAGIGVFGRRKG
ncbi:MAG: VPLPA-CTERM sorting domain-containing protein [Candidatus Methylumidiphilus sp.]